MSCVTIIWSMIASACLTLAAMHFLVWCRNRRAWASLLFSLAAAATVALAYCELSMMRAETPGQFATALRWLYVPTWVIVLSIVGFVRLYLRAGRAWLAWTTCAVRTLAVLANFLTGQNLNYREVTHLLHIPFLGESVSVAEGVPNPWMLSGQVGLLLFVVFVVDAAITAWRRGDRRQALVTGGSIASVFLAATIHSVLVFWGIVHWPLAASCFFMPVVAAMGYEMSREVLRAAQLSDDLRVSEERMTLAAEAAGVGVWVWSIPRNQVWGTERWLSLFGFAPDAAVTFEEVMQRIHPEDRDLVEREVRRSADDLTDYAGEFRAVLPDGTPRWISSRGRVYPDANGTPVRMAGAAIDITERKRAEGENLRLRAELTHATRAAALGEMAGALAHELNQPLAGVMTNAQTALWLLDRKPPDLDELRSALVDIVADDKRAAETLKRLRALVQKGEGTREPVDVNQVVRDVASLVRSDTLIRGIVLRVELAEGLPPVLADRIQLQQVVLNLLVNAEEAIGQGGTAPAEVVVRSACDASGSVVVSVQDTGIGIKDNEVERLFEPFYTTKPHGLGMGLSICRSIVNAHDGSIWATRNPDRGSTFSFSLPGHQEAVR